jgi:hypothetical protein
MRIPRVLAAAAALLALALTLGAGTAPPAVPAEPELVGTWKGILALWNRDLRVVFRFYRADDGSFSGTMDGLDQGAVGVPVDAVVVEGESVRFRVAPFHGGFEGKFLEDGAKLEGEWNQGGGTLPLVLERVADAPGPKPGQAPKEIWEGTLVLEGVSLRVVFRVFEMEDGSLAVLMDSPDQGARGMVGDAAILGGTMVRFEIGAVEGVYEGTKTQDGATVEGKWMVGGAPFPLVLHRADGSPGSPPNP